MEENIEENQKNGLEFDKKNMRGVLLNFPEMVRESLNFGKDVEIEGEIDQIFVLGMGGSGLGGDLLKTYLNDLKIPIHIIKDYNIPKYANKDSLFFAVSYSGNTEELISTYREAIKINLKRVISISAGGKLMELAAINRNNHITIPRGIQPRLSTPYQLIPMLNVLANHGIISDQEKIIKELAKVLEKPGFEEKAKEIAIKLKERVPIIYSSQRIFSVAEIWKIALNENAKTPAFYNLFPEFNHNEINGYINMTFKPHVIMIKDEEDHPRVIKRVKVIKKLLEERKIEVTAIALNGNNFLSRIFSSIYLGLWVSFYLAIEYETDPTEVEIIEDLKLDLKK